MLIENAESCNKNSEGKTSLFMVKIFCVYGLKNRRLSCVAKRLIW